MNFTFTVANVAGLNVVADKIIELTTNCNHFCFEAPMGAGKTTLITQICKKLEVNDYVSSPTYSIVNEYKGKSNTIYHFDLYRINNELELLDIGIEEILDSNAICFIEWPEKIENFLPGSYVKVKIQVKDTVREISLKTIKH